MLAATVLFSLVLGAPAATEAGTFTPGARGTDRGDVVDARDDDDDDEDENFEAEYFAFTTNDDLHESIADDTIMFHVAGILGCVGGQIWLPLLIFDEQPEDWLGDALISWAIWAVPVWILSIIPITAIIGWPLALIVHFYVVPVNVINAWDRAAKANGMKERKSRKKKKKKKRDRDGDEESSASRLPANQAFAAAAPPSMAY